MYLGIDLGTSNSAVVGHLEGRTRLFKTSDGLDVLPSVIYLDRRGHLFVGKAAQDRIMTAPKNVAAGFKRLMGTSSSIPLGDQTWTPEKCSAQIIRTLVGQATTESGVTEIEGAVITIPAAFNQMQSEATISAARDAGLEHVSLLQEPVAAAMASMALGKQKDGVFLVYDLGGGTFDVALVLSTAGSVNVIAHEGINMLGGRDFDRMIFDRFVRPWLTDTFDLPENFPRDERYKHLITVARFASERAKIQLSASEQASIFASEDEIRATDASGEEIYISVDISRSQVEDLVRDRLVDSIELCRKIISNNGYSHEDISRIVPIGGPSKMPIVRSMLQDELGILVEQGLDPMTAVATGAAIFAESRNWDGERSTRKAARGRETIEGPIAFSIDFASRVSDETTRFRIKPTGQLVPGCEVEIVDEDGSSSGRRPIDGVVELRLNLPSVGENRFRVRVTDPSGMEVPHASREIVVTRTEASASSIPMTFTLAVKKQTGKVGYERNELEVLLPKGAPLPADGQSRFRSAKTIRGGEDQHISIEFFEMAAGVKNPEHNLHIGDFQLSAARDLEHGERINRGDEIIIHWNMSDNGTLKFSVELPSLGRLVDAHNLYLAPAGHVNFDGKTGAEAASSLLAQAERDLCSLEETLGADADPDGSIRKRIERQHDALSTSIDAETNRAVSEEARKLRQEIALARLAPKNSERVLIEQVNEAEVEFERVQTSASQTEIDRHGKLLITARRAIRERDFEVARQAVDEMESIRFKLLAENPEFLIGLLTLLADERNLAMDPALHDSHIAEGVEAAKTGDLPHLRSVIGKIYSNLVSTSGNVTQIVQLAHLLGA